MRSDVERLEAQLLASWTGETLEAYGAALRAAGDPRGELIAIDLHGGDDDEKYDHEIAWLGDDVASSVTTRYGFVEDCIDLEDVLPALDQVLRFARMFDIAGEPDEVTDALAILASAPRPWLGALSIRQLDDRTASLVDAGLGWRVSDATPNLRKLVVHGHRVLGAFDHPTVERLVVDGHDAMAVLLGHGRLPRVDTLDLALHPDTVIEHEPPPDELRALLPASAFPLLRTLDVSRNEPRATTLAPNCLGGRTPIFEVLGRLGVAPQLVNLRVPSVRSADRVAQLQTAIDRMPSLRTLDIARTYTKPRSELATAARVTTAPPWPWPPGDAIREYDALVFLVDPSSIRVDLDRAYEVAEAAPPETHAGWTALWNVVTKIGHDDKRVEMIAMRDLAAVLASFGDEEHTTWDDLVELLDELPSNVAVRRIDGFESTTSVETVAGVATPREERVPASTERIVEHEQALRVAWDLDRLAVYADELQQLGDERGELIALDLQLARERRPDLETRREELHAQIFGDETWVDSNLGFASIKVSAWGDGADSLSKFLAGDAARYLSAVELGGPVDRVVADVRLLARERRPWLRRLAVETMGEFARAVASPDELAERWPLLEELELAADDPTRLFDRLHHPRVRSLRITGWPAFASLGSPWPALRAIDLAYGGGLEEPDDPIGQLASARAFPALRVLDLSRNEPSDEGAIIDRDHHRHQAGAVDIFTVLPRYAVLAQLTTLRLPSLRTMDRARMVQHVLDLMPNLETLEIVRMYPGAPAIQLRHPTAKLVVPPPSAWPAMDQVEEDAALEVEDVTIPLHDAIFAMERHHASLGPAAREAWNELWTAYRNNRRKFTFSAATLYRAADALAKIDDYLIDDFVDDLVEALHALAIADKAVAIKRGTT